MKSMAIPLVASALPAAAQWLDSHDTRTPVRDGKPDLKARAPRWKGKPDLSGVWEAERTPLAELNRVLGEIYAKQQVDFKDNSRYFLNVFWGLKPQDEPLRPAAVAVLQQHATEDFPTSRCLPAGVPAGLLVSSFKIVQTPDEILMLTGIGDPARQVYIDGRPLPRDPQPA